VTTIDSLTQWSLVGVAVLLAVGYALKVLMPRAWRRPLARGLKARGAGELARSFEQGIGCDACAERAVRLPADSARKTVNPITSENLTTPGSRREGRDVSP
jgi:hypothetical protein